MRWGFFCALLLLALGAYAVEPTVDTLPNGLRTIVQPTTTSQVVSVELLIDLSALDEPWAIQGVRHVLLTSMLEGSARASGTQIRQQLTANGGFLEGRVHADMLELTVTTPVNALPIALASLAEVTCHPQLSDDGIRAAVEQTRLAAAAEPVGALNTASRFAHSWLYADHPYYGQGQGTEATLARITPALVRTVYQSYVIPGNAVLAVAGRCTPDAVRAEIAEHFGSWTGRTRVPRGTFSAPEVPVSRAEVIEAPVKSTCVMLTFPACGAADEDFLTLRVIDSLLGSGTGSRLFRTVREKLHLAYEVSTAFPSQANCSDFSVYALTHSRYLEETKQALAGELARLQVEPVPADELQRAKAYLKSRYLLSHQYSSQHAFDLAWYELLGHGVAYDREFCAKVDAITADEVQQVARKYFTRYYLVVVMPQTLQ